MLQCTMQWEGLALLRVRLCAGTRFCKLLRCCPSSSETVEGPTDLDRAICYIAAQQLPDGQRVQDAHLRSSFIGVFRVVSPADKKSSHIGPTRPCFARSRRSLSVRNMLQTAAVSELRFSVSTAKAGSEDARRIFRLCGAQWALRSCARLAQSMSVQLCQAPRWTAQSRCRVRSQAFLC